jgi:hypothetical protein
MATQESIDLAQQMYVVYYGRPGDGAGIFYWADVFDSSDDLGQALNAFGNSDEFSNTFGSLSSEALITNLYQQLYGRDPDPDGLAFYSGRLTSGLATLASLGKQIADGSQNEDLSTLDNRIEVANSFTNSVTSEGVIYDESSVSSARSLLSAIDSTGGSLSTALGQVLSLISAMPLDGTPDPVEKPLAVLSNEGAFLLDFSIGSASSDTLTVGSGAGNAPTLLGLDGNDTLSSQSGLGFLFGGDGDDMYTTGNSGFFVVQDSSGSADHLTVPSTFDELRVVTLNSGKDVVLFDGSMVLLLPDWKDVNGRIESYTLDDGQYSYSDLVAAVNIYSEGDVSSAVAGSVLDISGEEVDQLIVLFDYLNNIDSQNLDELVTFSTENFIGSESLSEYLF